MRVGWTRTTQNDRTFIQAIGTHLNELPAFAADRSFTPAARAILHYSARTTCHTGAACDKRYAARPRRCDAKLTL